jgi:hypothetical protein
MPNNRWKPIMRNLSFCCLLTIAVFATPVISAAPVPIVSEVPSQHASLAELQARFAKVQQLARPRDMPFELRIVDAGQDLLGQANDGIVSLPQDWALAAPDGETRDFLMLLALADAIAREPAPQGPSKAAKIVTGTLGYIAATVADYSRAITLPAPKYESNAKSSEPVPALRALAWATAAGGCEARIVAGLHQLKAINGPIGHETRRVIKTLGAVAWTPNDRCGPSPS